jgi:hypothetical protein
MTDLSEKKQELFGKEISQGGEYQFAIPMQAAYVQFYADYPVNYLNPACTLKQYETFLKILTLQTTTASKQLIHLKWHLKLWSILDVLLILVFMIGILIIGICGHKMRILSLVLFIMFNISLCVTTIWLSYGILRLSRAYAEVFRKYRNHVILYCEKWNHSSWNQPTNPSAPRIAFHLVDTQSKALAPYIYVMEIDQEKVKEFSEKEKFRAQENINNCVEISSAQTENGQSKLTQPFTNDVQIQMTTLANEVHAMQKEGRVEKSQSKPENAENFHATRIFPVKTVPWTLDSPELQYLEPNWNALLKQYPKIILNSLPELYTYLRANPTYFKVSIEVQKSTMASPNLSDIII